MNMHKNARHMPCGRERFVRQVLSGQTPEAAYRAGSPPSPAPHTIEGRLVAQDTEPSPFDPGERLFHQKFGYGEITRIEGIKPTINFDHAGGKRVIDSFVQRH